MITKVIKTSNWTTSTGKKGVTLVVAYKGRVFTVNKEDFESSELTVVGDVATFTTAVEVVVDSYVDNTGVTKQGLRLKPKMDLTMGLF